MSLLRVTSLIFAAERNQNLFFPHSGRLDSLTDLLSGPSLFEFLTGVHRGGLSGRALFGYIVFLVQL